MPFLTRTRQDLPENVPRSAPSIPIPFTRSSKSNGAIVHVLEKGPSRIGVAFKSKRKTRRGQWSKRPAAVFRWKIEVPWQYFIVRMNEVGAITDTFVWFAPKKLSDEGGAVFLPPLPNIYPSAHICNGTIRVNFADPVHVRVSQAFESFWTTPFTEETWPEMDYIIPSCWSSDVDPENAYFIEYGYLRWIFEYWQRHDEKHSRKEWLKDHRPCGFPWRQYVVQNKALKKWHGSTIGTLSDAMEYALDFVAPKRSENDE